MHRPHLLAVAGNAAEVAVELVGPLQAVLLVVRCCCDVLWSLLQYRVVHQTLVTQLKGGQQRGYDQSDYDTVYYGVISPKYQCTREEEKYREGFYLKGCNDYFCRYRLFMRKKGLGFLLKDALQTFGFDSFNPETFGR